MTGCANATGSGSGATGADGWLVEEAEGSGAVSEAAEIVAGMLSVGMPGIGSGTPTVDDRAVV